MTAEIHDMVAAGNKVAIRATYRGTDEGGFIPSAPATGKAFEMDAIYIAGSTTRDKSPSTGCRRHHTTDTGVQRKIIEVAEKDHSIMLGPLSN
jgi:hypothetical protein